MAVILDATPGSATANSFATVAWSDAYMSGRLYSGVWDVAVLDTKNRALITATRQIVEAFQRFGWQGSIMSAAQALPVPRAGMTTPDGLLIPSSAIPAALANATSELALRLLEAGSLLDYPAETDGLKRLKAGPVEIEWSGSSGASTELPDAVFNMIAFLTGRLASKMIVPLVRV
jgi:hypothetical protein